MSLEKYSILYIEYSKSIRTNSNTQKVSTYYTKVQQQDAVKTYESHTSRSWFYKESCVLLGAPLRTTETLTRAHIDLWETIVRYIQSPLINILYKDEISRINIL